MVLSEKATYEIAISIKCDKCGKENIFVDRGKLIDSDDGYELNREDMFLNRGWVVDGMNSICDDCAEEEII